MIGRDKTGVRDNLRCNVVSSYGGCTDGGCTVKEVGSIRMSTKHLTMQDCLCEFHARVPQDHDKEFRGTHCHREYVRAGGREGKGQASQGTRSYRRADVVEEKTHS